MSSLVFLSSSFYTDTGAIQITPPTNVICFLRSTSSTETKTPKSYLGRNPVPREVTLEEVKPVYVKSQ